MKQLPLQGVTPFADAPIDAPEDVVTACNSEADAVKWCLEFAKELHGVDQLTIAKLCGWKSSSFLSEIASEGSEKRLPEKRRRRFAFATGCNLVDQWHRRQDLLKELSGKKTDHDRKRKAIALMRAEYERRLAA